MTLLRNQSEPGGAMVRGRWEQAVPVLLSVALIVAAVVAALFRTALEGRISAGDPLQLWLPTWSFLGHALRSGHVPAWNPAVFSGTPFAADPQSGWMYLPPMVLFTAFRASLAMRMMVVLQPILAGVGLLAFLRSERLPWYAASSGGVAIAVGIAGSGVGHSLPASGSLAWTAVTLAGCSRLTAAQTWPRRLIWILLATIAWGQMAAAQFSLTLFAGSVTVVAYMAAATIRKVTRGEWQIGTAAAVVGVLLTSAIGVNLAYLAPRLPYIGETNLGLGYGGLQALGRRLAGLPPRPFHAAHGGSLAWILDLSVAPGAYLGGAILLGVIIVWAGRRTATIGALLAAVVVTYGLSVWLLPHAIPASLDRFRVIDLYLHGPMWLGYELLLLLAALGAFGLEAWKGASARARGISVVVAVVVWIGIPLALGTSADALIPAVFGQAAAVGLLEVGRRRPAVLFLLPVVLAVELPLAAHLPAGWASHASFAPRPQQLRPPDQPSDLVSPLALLRSVQFAAPLERNAGRYVVVVGRLAHLVATPDNRIDTTTPPFWLPNWSLVSGAQNAGGANAIQLLRYWAFVRAVQSRNFNYHAVKFRQVPDLAGDLLHVEWLVRARRRVFRGGLSRAPISRRWVIHSNPSAAPMASLLGSWRAAGDPWTALRIVTDETFDPKTSAVIEDARGSPAAASPAVGTASYRATGSGSATIRVTAMWPALLLVRIPYAKAWHATIDGRPVADLPVDYVDQGVIVPEGTHVVRLTFSDSAIIFGLYASGLWIGALLAAAAVLHVRRRAARRPIASPLAEEA